MESPQPQRKKFKTTQDWNEFIIAAQQQGKALTGQDLFALRKACYAEIEKHRGRPLLIYATKFFGRYAAGHTKFY